MNSLQEEKLEAFMARKSVCKKRLNLKLQQQNIIIIGGFL